MNYSDVGEKPYDLVYAGLWKACIVKDGSERCESLLIGQGMPFFKHTIQDDNFHFNL